MRVVVLYCHPALNLPIYGPAARLFTESYISNPPGKTDHELIVGLNGATEPGPVHHKLFSPMAPQFFLHNNWGKDIGMFIAAADRIECDLLVCLGAHVHFHKPGWLDRIVESFLDCGPTLFGAWGFHHPRPHLRTTAFWLPPELLRMYPFQIGDRQRYEFEHGGNSITSWIASKGFEPVMVTWKGCFETKDWHHIGGDDCLMLDQHCDRGGIR